MVTIKNFDNDIFTYTIILQVLIVKRAKRVFFYDASFFLRRASARRPSKKAQTPIRVLVLLCVPACLRTVAPQRNGF